MNLEQFIYVTEVYKKGSISNAAKSCHVSIPAISQSIANLEKELDVKIFNRSRMGAIPTPEGLKIIRKANNIIASIEDIHKLTKPKNNLIQGNLNINAIPSLIILIFKAAFEFKKDYPDVEIKITEKSTPEIKEAIELNKDEIGFLQINTELLGDSDNWIYQTLMKDKMYLCVNHESPLRLKRVVEPHEFLDEKIVLYSGSNYQKIIDQYFEKYGAMQVLFESNQFEIIKKTIAEGFAVGLLSGLLLKNDPRVKNGEIIPVPVKGFSDIEVPYGWLRMKNVHFSLNAREFLKYVNKQIQSGDY